MTKKKAPNMEGMIEVTERNRKSLEKKYGFEISKDAEYILPPEALQAVMDDPEAWEEEQ